MRRNSGVLREVDLMRADDHAVRDLVVFFEVLQAECIGELTHVGGVGGDKVPVRKAVRMIIQVGESITSKHRCGVIRRVEADRQ